MLNKKSIDDINVKGKRVLCRCDFNVPLDKETGEIKFIEKKGSPGLLLMEERLSFAHILESQRDQMLHFLLHQLQRDFQNFLVRKLSLLLMIQL